ncbi:MAG TPA: alpha/beta fold hydrolase [Drouetiella sp.]
MNSPAVASELKPINPSSEVAQEVAEYRIDQSPRSVVTEWKADNAKAYMIAIHGFGLHKGAFDQFAKAMQERNVTTYALDVRGFGGWGSKEKQSLNFDKTFEDVTALVHEIRSEHADKPIFLIGESMGGAIALQYSARFNGVVDGVISSVPANDRFAKFRTAFSVGTSYILTGGNRINLKNILVHRVFHNKELQRSWETDPDSKLNFKLAELLTLRRFMHDAETSATQIRSLPVLVVQGERDRLVKPQGTEKIFDELQTKDKQLLERPQGEHLTFEDGQFDDKVVSSVENWISQHSNIPILSASAQ